MTHRIIVAGIGPGDSSYLLPKAQNYIENARILVGGRRALADYSNGRAKECSIGADIPSVLEFIRTSLSEDDVVVMVSGDPGYWTRCAGHFRSTGSRSSPASARSSLPLRGSHCRGTARVC